MIDKDSSESSYALRDAQTRVREARLIFTTCAGSGLGLLRYEKFDIVLIDKASQVTKPESLIPLTKGCRRAIFIGDHAQIGSTVRKHAVVAGFHISLFERHYDYPVIPGVAKVMLDTQYGIHPEICVFTSREFYNDELKSAETNMEITLPLSQFPWPEDKHMVFIQCSTPEDLGNLSKSNSGQVKVCKAIYTLLKAPATASKCDHSAPTATLLKIAIITPYIQQIKLLRTEIPDCEVFTTDRCQGTYFDIVIFVTVRCNAHYDIGILEDTQCLNVATTRARAGMIIIGDRTTLVGRAEGDIIDKSKAVWASLLRSCRELQLPPPT
jgi:superfamily I DNA and/or RNA helicase